MTFAMSAPEQHDDPPPAPPLPPADEDCCHGGCDRCVLELYDEAREKYETALRAWEERRREKTP